MNTNFYFLIFFFAILEFDGIFALECYSKSGDGPQSVITCPSSSFSRCFTDLCPDSYGNYKVSKGCMDWSGEGCSPSININCKGQHQKGQQNECTKCDGDLCNNEDIQMTKCYQKLYEDDEEGPRREINCPTGKGFLCYSQKCGFGNIEGVVKGCAKDCYAACGVRDRESKCHQCTTDGCNYNYSASPSANIFLTIFAMFLALAIFAWV